MGKLITYTDGSCDNKSQNHEGGAAYIILSGNEEIIHRSSKGFKNTTNNRMEVLAIISAVNFCPEGTDLTVYTDSQYAITVLQNRTKKQNLNMDLILKFRVVSAKLKSINFVWVKGHAGNKYNEMADQMAHAEYDKVRYKLKAPPNGRAI